MIQHVGEYQTRVKRASAASKPLQMLPAHLLSEDINFFFKRPGHVHNRCLTRLKRFKHSYIKHDDLGRYDFIILHALLGKKNIVFHHVLYKFGNVLDYVTNSFESVHHPQQRRHVLCLLQAHVPQRHIDQVIGDFPLQRIQSVFPVVCLPDTSSLRLRHLPAT
jgi:hypothetical protein